jgi:dipeptidyl-peptidase-4
MKRILAYFFICFIFNTVAQQKELSIEDAVMGLSKGLYPSSLSNLNWIKNTQTFVYQENKDLLFTNAKSNKKEIGITLKSLQSSYPELKNFPQIIDITASELTFRQGNVFEIFDYTNNTKLATIKIPNDGASVDYSSSSQKAAFTIANNLYIADAGQLKMSVTDHNDSNIVAGQAIHRSEFGIVKGTFWSPHGNYLAFYEKDETNVTSYPIVDITTYPATLKPVKYPMVGQDSEIARIGIYDTASKSTTYLNIDTSDEHYLTNLSWSPDEKIIYIVEINRDQNHFKVNAYDRFSGNKIKTLFEESNDKWTEPETGLIFIPNSAKEFLWMSERDGFMNLYRYDINGNLLNQVTQFNWVIKSILGFDIKGQHVYITGTGSDPRDTHVFKVNIKKGKYTKLTKTSGTHSGLLSDDGNYLIDSYSSLTIPRKIDLVNTKNQNTKPMFVADNPLKNYALGNTDFITLKADDGTDLYAKMIKPYGFDPNRKYPVLIYVYGGPHAQLVTNSWGGGSSLWMPAFATLEDYIVFTVDNRGSANRGFAFESIIHRQLGDVEIEDQLTGIAYLKGLPYIDYSRLAVNGWSYGGFMTTSLMLRYPGVFTTAVAGGPVTDWKYYEVMYGERYMDTPAQNDLGYKKARVHNYIRNLDGKMLIIHGSIDPVVVPQHSMTLLKEAVKHKVPIDFFTYPMHEHNVRGIDRVHLINKMTDYILQYNK